MLHLADDLRARGHYVSFLSVKERGFADYTQTRGFDSHFLRVRTKVDPYSIAKMANLMRRLKPDVVHCHLSTSAVNGAIAARLAGIPSLSTVHGMSGKLSFLPSEHLIAVSSKVRDHLVGQGVSEAKISIVFNGIPLRCYDSDSRIAARALLDLAPDRPVIGTTARLTPMKGLVHALYALARIREEVPDVVYIVMGDGEQKEELHELAHKLGLKKHVRWMGYRHDVQDLLPGLDVFMFPSLREAMGISIVEAMSAHVPVVAAAIGGIPEVVDKESGVLVPPSDPVGLADATVRLLKDKQLKSRMGTAAYDRAVSEFSSSRMGERTLAVYFGLLNHRNRLR
ncbi:MAG: glycosyltransferase family 4 protein [Chthonomonadaceae bacterium]|nr:glycosyltransferase family 4 protein [Chthonomonadaceae bacterium]